MGCDLICIRLIDKKKLLGFVFFFLFVTTKGEEGRAGLDGERGPTVKHHLFCFAFLSVTQSFLENVPTQIASIQKQASVHYRGAALHLSHINRLLLYSALHNRLQSYTAGRGCHAGCQPTHKKSLIINRAMAQPAEATQGLASCPRTH